MALCDHCRRQIEPRSKQVRRQLYLGIGAIGAIVVLWTLFLASVKMGIFPIDTIRPVGGDPAYDQRVMPAAMGK